MCLEFQDGDACIYLRHSMAPVAGLRRSACGLSRGPVVPGDTNCVSNRVGDDGFADSFSLSSDFQKAALDGERHGVCAVARIELGQHAADARLDGFFRHAERFADFAVAVPHRSEL